MEIAEVVDYRERVAALDGREGSQAGSVADRRRQALRLRPRRHVREPAAQLRPARPRARARSSSTRDAGSSSPWSCPRASRSPARRRGTSAAPAVPPPSHGEGEGKSIVCFCEDVTTKDFKDAIAEGFDSIQIAKRYTTATMGPCQGRLCHLNAVRVAARETRTDEGTIGTTTARPPTSPVSMGLLAGRPHEAAKRTSMHHRHKDMGATVFWTGRLAAAALLLGRPAGGGARGARVARRDRRLDARQAPRQGPGRGRVPRPPLPEPLLRPQGRAGPLRGAHERRAAGSSTTARSPASPTTSST